MYVAERIAEMLLAQTITVGILRQTMVEEGVGMEQAVGIWKKRLQRYASKHTEEEGWLRNAQELAAEWADPDNDDKVAEAIDQAKTGAYIEGYVDGFADSMKARGLQSE